MNPYQKLAVEILKKASQQGQFLPICKKLLISERQLEQWLNGRTPIRLSLWLIILEKLGTAPIDLMAAIVAPKNILNPGKLTTQTQVDMKLVAPLLRELRGPKTLQQVATLLGLKAHATYAHWESGRRFISLPAFLQVLDVLSSRLPIVCEMMGSNKNLPASTFKSVLRPENFSERFFQYPWTPTVYLAIVSEKMTPSNRGRLLPSFKKLGINSVDIDISLKILFDLRLIRVEKHTFKNQKEYFYVPATIEPKLLAQLNQFWFSKSMLLLQLPGYHKIDQMTLEKASIPKITQWIGELRERIRAESKSGEPETMVHFHWQMADLL